MMSKTWCRKFCQKIWNKVGFRGTFLMLLGFYDIWYGVYLVAGGATQHAFSLNNTAWGWIWIGTGLFLLTGAPGHKDRWQFGWAVFIKMVLALEYLLLINIIPWDWIRTLYWGGFALIILLVSAWPEPQKYDNTNDVIDRAKNGHDS